MSKFTISSSNIGAFIFVDLNKITISLYLISLKLFVFLSNTWNLLSTNSFILFATNLASICISSIFSNSSAFSDSSSISISSSFSFKSMISISVSKS